MIEARMLVRELRKHFPARIPEWWSAWTMFAWGTYVLLNPSIVLTPGLAGLVAISPAVDDVGMFWGTVAVMCGMVRATALFINGAYSRTPVVRAITSAVSAFVWFQIVLGFWALGRPSTGVVMYCAVMTLDFVSAYRAGYDAVMAESIRRARSGAKSRGGSGTYGNFGTT